MATFSLLLLLVGLSSNSDVPEISYRCYVSTGIPKPVRLEMAIFGNSRWFGGYVQYESGQKPISIIELSTVTNEMSEDAPSEYKTTWLEIIGGRPAGKYVVITQGARTYGFEYKSAGGLKAVKFVEDLESQPDGNSGCSWH